jgi:hypothetical protein
MWSASERQAARALSLLVGATATVLLVITLQLVGRSGHTNVVPVTPPKHVEPGCVPHAAGRGARSAGPSGRRPRCRRGLTPAPPPPTQAHRPR